LKDVVESAKARSDADEAAQKEVVGHLKAGRWGHATEALLQHVTRGAAQTAPSAVATASPAVPPTQPQAVTPAPAAGDNIDLSAGFTPKVAITPQIVTPSSSTSTGDIDLSAGFVPKESQAATEDHGIGGQAIGAAKGPFAELSQTATGLHDLFQSPRNEEEKAIQQKLMIGEHGEMGGRLALAMYRAGHGFMQSLRNAYAARQSEDSVPGKILGTAENYPMIGDIVKMMEKKEYGQAFTQGLTRAALLGLGGKGAAKLPKIGEEADAAIPRAPVVAGTELPETAGQAATRANPVGVGSDVKGMEEVAQKLPLSQSLRKVGQDQQGAAREILANKAKEVAKDADASKAADTGQPIGNTASRIRTNPEAVEENISNAAQSIREAGNAKYEAIGQAAKDADVSKAVESAQSILQDENVSKILPKSAREALSKVSQSLAERESISKQIYGKGFNDLEPAKQAEVSKAMQGGQESAGISSVLKARSELAQAANGMKDAADRFQIHKALDSFDGAIDDTLKAHDAKTGANLSGDLAEAKRLWSKKYAFEEFRDGLQNLMRDQPHTGPRQINGEAFQKLVNDLDPRGAPGKTTLQRMFPGNAQHVADLHELADFMGRNQAHAGGMASGMAKLRLLGLRSSAIGLLGNVFGFSKLMSKPGIAGALLVVLKGGVNSAKVAGAVGELNRAADDTDVHHLSDNGASSPENQDSAVGPAQEPTLRSLSAQPKRWQDVMPGNTAKPAAQPAKPAASSERKPVDSAKASDGTTYKVGEVVSLKGKQVRITKIYSDRSFDYEPAK
jgi:hypothetical protein